MPPSLPRLFLSYAAKDLAEVEILDLALRRRGVPLWRDRRDLKAGKRTLAEIEAALGEAAGAVVYLTESAAASRWVRERELALALRRARGSPSFLLVPIFRADLHRVSEKMMELGERPALEDGPSPYDLRSLNGYVVDRDRAAEGLIEAELATAADHVLGSFVAARTESRGGMGPLRMGAVTRRASLRDFELDLLLDGREDFPATGPLPDRSQCNRHLLAALRSLQGAVSEHWPGMELELALQCHLSLALALGFQFRRNTGASLEVVEIHTGERWRGPGAPHQPAAEQWAFAEKVVVGDGRDLALAVGVSGPIAGKVEVFLQKAAVPTSRLLTCEPAHGTGKASLAGLAPDVPHRMAVAVAERLTAARAERGYRTLHLFYAGPPAMAVLLAQQLSNVGPIQTYEWLDAEERYTPTFRLES